MRKEKVFQLERYILNLKVNASRINVHVRDSNGDTVPVEIVNNNDGTFTVTYTPAGTLPLTVSASFDDKPIFGYLVNESQTYFSAKNQFRFLVTSI